jgi:hypothetical protein
MIRISATGSQIRNYDARSQDCVCLARVQELTEVAVGGSV